MPPIQSDSDHRFLEKVAARRKATGWLVDYVGNMVMAGVSEMVQNGETWVWRFHAYLTSFTHAPRGPIGEVDVDAMTGDILNDQSTIEGMYARGEHFIT
jgi:hypothetical protein